MGTRPNTLYPVCCGLKFLVGGGGMVVLLEDVIKALLYSVSESFQKISVDSSQTPCNTAFKTIME